MADRYTTKDAHAAFERLASRLGRPYSRDGHVYTGKPWEPVHAGELWTRTRKPEADRNVAFVGAWYLDHNSVYGGYVVHEIANDGGGVSCPLGHDRHPAREFCELVRFAENCFMVQDENRERSIRKGVASMAR